MRRSLLIASAVLAFGAIAIADAPRVGVVTGVVTGPGGEPMPGATVQLMSERGTASVVSDDGGTFRFAFLAPGSYTVRADLEGFQPAEGAIVVSAGGRSDLELHLQNVAGEEIVVTGEAPLVNKYDVSAGGTVGSQELETVPTLARNYIQALELLPGVVNDANSLRFDGFQPDIEGTRGTRAGYYVEGVDVTFSRTGGASRLQVPMFALSEVKIESSGADAQYSRSVGGIVSTVLKSGTNQFHGEAAWYGRNLSWDENYDLTPVLQPDELKSSWEASLGGPIVRDRLWFFVAYGDRRDPGADLLGDGVTTLDSGGKQENKLVKLDYRPTVSHSLTATYVDSPFVIPGFVSSCADLGATWLADWPADFKSFNWNWAITDSVFMETHAASQDTSTHRLPAVDGADPGADPWKPAGNDYTYNDQATGLLWNGVVAPDVGHVEFPRDQANASASWFTGVHDLKLGVDYQSVKWRTDVVTVPMVIGIGFNPDLPGGFARPLFFRAFYGVPPGQWAENPTTNWAVYGRDRLSYDRWTLNLGLRWDWQKHENDAGVTTVDAKDLSPRLSAVYDVNGNGTLLLSATAGRYVYQMPQGWSENFNTTPTGRLYYDQYAFNPATQAYDVYQRSVLPPEPGEVPQVDTHHKDEFTIGADWAIRPGWALKAKLLYWEQKHNAQIYNQLDDSGAIVPVVENNPWAEAKRRALHLSVQRRFADNWMVAASYTWSKTEGNCQESIQADTGCVPAPGRLIDVLNPDTGEPYSLQNIYGRLETDRPHVFKVRGLYQLALGAGHTLNVSGFYSLQSGQTWTPTETVDILDGTETMNVFTEPRGSERTPTWDQFNLSLEWQFPIFKQLDGGVRADVINVFNQQELIGSEGLDLSGSPSPTTLNYQKPRFFRLMARVTF